MNNSSIISFKLTEMETAVEFVAGLTREDITFEAKITLVGERDKLFVITILGY